jgi:dihydroorotate dehydrogenase (NAD+) catalytic subunit
VAGADAVCLINTLTGMAIDTAERKPSLGNIHGGLSGPAIKPVALSMVYQVAKEIDIPVIGCGGISSPEDALEFIMAGASAIEVGTFQFANPAVMLDVLEGIEQYMQKEGLREVSEIIGAAQR